MGHLKNNQQRKRRRYLISRNTGKSIKSRIQNFLSMCLGGYTYYSSNAYKVFDSEKNSLGEQKFTAEMVFIHEAKQRVAAYAKNPVDHFVDKLVSRKNRFGHNIFAFFSSPNSIVVEPKLA